MGGKRGTKPPFFYRLARFMTYIIFKPLFLIKIIKGKNIIPEHGGFVAAGNHISNFDPILLSIAQKRQIRYMAKVELFKVWPVSAVCRNAGAIPVTRGGNDLNSVTSCINVVKEGGVFGIFAEGHRYRTFDVQNGKAGAVMIAHRTGAPIYPFAVYARRGVLALFCKYTVAFGDPVTTAELGVTGGSKAEYRDATLRLMEIIGGLRAECAASRR